MTPRFSRALTASLVLVLAAVAFGVESDSHAETRSVGQSKPSCPHGQAAVILDGKRGCRPLAQALPIPRKGDARLSILRTLLTSDWGNPPDLKGRRPPSIEKLLADFSPAAAARVRKAIAEIPATVDRLTRQKASRLRAPSAYTETYAAAPCGAPTGVTKSDSTKQDLGSGSSFDLHVSVTAGRVTAGFGIEGAAKDGSNRKVRWDVDFDQCEENLAFHVPECPTAEGKIDGTGKTSFKLKISSLKDGGVEHSATIEIRHNARSKGTVGVDAKLERVEIEDTYQSTVTTSRQSIFWGPSSEKGTVNRTAWMDMRTGRYDLGKPNVVDVKVSYSGILSIFTQDALAKARVAAELAKSSDETFAKTVKHVVEEYRERETAWQTPNTCASLQFTPPSRSLRLRDGQTGTFKGSVKAKRGGTTPDGRWRLVSRRNATVAPARAGGKEPAFSYRVTNADRGVSASFRATSPAGVAKGDWVQGGTDLPLRFTGTFSGRTRESAGGVQTLDYSFSGTVTFVRSSAGEHRPGFVAYTIEKMDYRTTLTIGGMCSGSASESASSRNNDEPTNVLQLAKEAVPNKGRQYEINFTIERPAGSTLRANCSGTVVPYPWAAVAQVITAPLPFYADARATRLRGTRNIAGTPITYTWDLRGSG